jgi:hypothetical protein
MLMPINSVLFLFLILNYSYSQPIKYDKSFKREIAQQKEMHIKQIQIAEKMKTANQDEYDVKYYSLNLAPNPVTATLSGIVNVLGEVLAPTLNQVDLNFWDGMNILEVHITGSTSTQLSYIRNNDILSIQLDRTYIQGEEFNIEIVYNGQPQNSPYYSFVFDSHNNNPMIWTLSSGFGARAWWPCKDVLSDKPDSIDIRVSVPGNLIVASNGTLRETTIQNNQTTYWWHEGYPIATYLVFLAIHPYEIHYENYLYNNNQDTMKIHFYSFPGNYNNYLDINLKVKDMIAAFSDMFGQYPFVEEKYGQADFMWGGGMEHQTCTTYGSWNESLFAHEIAHQWWGDMITCDSYHHIWLNEGFASYSEALWYEYLYPGYSASEYQMDYQLYLGPGTIYVEDPLNETIFDVGLSYDKASWVLHMLRHVVGENEFFDILRTYYSSTDHQYGTATTEQFQAISEQVSGINLEKFFQQWIYEEFYPKYEYTWSWTQNGSNYDIQLDIEQTQNNHIFWMPIEITIFTINGEETFVVWDSLQTQSFQLSVQSEPVNLELDRNNWIIKLIEEPIINPTFDQGILLVNGVLFDSYDEEIRPAYEARAFWGDYNIEFWDCFEAPANGYPSTLPYPIGHGKIPNDILDNYSAVIWIGNHYGGDVGQWQQTAIHSYLQAGGNVLLLTRRGQGFIFNELQDYLGITWVEDPQSTIQNCVAVYPGLQSNIINGSQSYNAVFETSLNHPESTLLFKETISFSEPRGLGVWRKPQNGGTHKNDGGQFAFISGRPYRYHYGQLKSNIKYILENFFKEMPEIPEQFFLYQNYPNPFNQFTTIEYDLNNSGRVKLEIFNILGEKVSTLVDGWQTARKYEKIFNASKLASGIYFYKLKTAGYSKTKKLLYIK